MFVVIILMRYMLIGSRKDRAELLFGIFYRITLVSDCRHTLSCLVLEAALLRNHKCVIKFKVYASSITWHVGLARLAVSCCMSTIISGSHKVAGSVLGTLLVKILSTDPDAGTLKTLLC